MPRPIVAKIDAAALTHNLNVVRGYAKEQKVWSVIKADAYGHGIENVLPYLNATDGFALLDLDEARRVRACGWKGPILLLEGFFQLSDLDLIDDLSLATSIHSLWQLDAIENHPTKNRIDVYIKVNSGMNRLGIRPDELSVFIAKAKGIRNISSITIMSHFATADSSEGVAKQLKIIEEASRDFGVPLCLANSAATIWHESTHKNAIRPGIILYGASPGGSWSDVSNVGLKAAMTLESEIIGIQNIVKGSHVGYGGRYIAQDNQRIGVVACGYADGYPRHATTGTPVWINGKKVPLVGAVSMDMITVDLTNCPEADLGTRVELWGQNLPVDEVASCAGTLGYELLSCVTARVLREIHIKSQFLSI